MKDHVNVTAGVDSSETGSRILYHLTTEKGFEGIERDGVIKPGPRNVWVEREPVSYIRKGGRIWLCQGSKLNWSIQHLWRQGKYVRIILGVDTAKALPFHLVNGIWYLTEETPSWFFVARVPVQSYMVNRAVGAN